MHSQKNKLNVIHLIEDLGSGGAERLLYTNLRHLDGDSIESSVVTVFSTGDFWKERIESLGVPVSTLNCSSIRNVGSGVSRFLKVVRQLKPDLIHTHLWAANVIGRIAGRIARVPVISSIHNPEYEPDALIDAARSSRVKVSISRVADRVTADFGCDRMIAVSEYVKRSIGKRIRYPLEKIDVLYNPIETSDQAGAYAVPNIHKELGVPEDSIILLNVGRLAPQKGFIYAVRAMPEILSHFPNAVLVSIGGQADKHWLSVVKTEIKKLGLENSVFLLGERRDVAEFLRRCSIFVFPSLFEGLGIALAEAMAAGCACIASNTGPIPEFIENEVNGLLVPPRYPAAICSAVSMLLNNVEKRHALGKAAQKTALELFEPRAAAQKLTEIYYSVAHPGK